jgi:hypothetical protein
MISQSIATKGLGCPVASTSIATVGVICADVEVVSHYPFVDGFIGKVQRVSYQGKVKHLSQASEVTHTHKSSEVTHTHKSNKVTHRHKFNKVKDED